MSSNALRLTRHAQRRATRHPASGVMRRASSLAHRPFLVVLSSPSGAGKTSICRAIERRDPHIAYSVSATTRPKREGEVNGRSYFFYTEKQFERLSKRGGLLERACVYDHRYGTPKAPLLRHLGKGRDVIADLDIQGMRSCRRALPGTVGVFIAAPDSGELGRRLRDRGADSAAAVRRREAERQKELAAIPEFDYLVVNDKLGDAVDDVMAIIRAERRRTSRMSPTTSRRNPRRKTGGRRPRI
jgi:guanylate kinase